MKIKACIIQSEYDIQSSVEDLIAELSEPSLHISSFATLENTDMIRDHIMLDSGEWIYLFFRNPYIRFNKLAEILELFSGNPNFTAIYDSKRELLAFSKKYFEGGSVDFTLNESVVTYKKPDYTDPLHILIYAHERADYFKLSLNSLLYSLDNEADNVTIFLSQPSAEVESIARRRTEGTAIQVFKTERNIGVSAINLYLQLLQPKKFAIFEEDFILPQFVRYVLPFWRAQFSNRLDSFDIVSFQTSVENQCFDFFRGAINITPLASRNPFFHQWTQDPYRAQLTGNGLATKLDFYLQRPVLSTNFIHGDGSLFERAKTSISSIRGYHIGWNQEIDGFPRIGDFSRFPPSPDFLQEVIDCKIEKKLTLDLRDLNTLKGRNVL